MSEMPNFADLIKNARAKVKTPGKGRITGAGADIAIVLLADKYNQVFKTNDADIEQSLKNNDKLDTTDKLNFSSTFKGYDSFLQYTAKHKDISIEMRDMQSWIYIRALHLLYKLEYIAKSKSAGKSAERKNTMKARAIKLWKESHLGTDDASIIKLKQLYHDRFGEELYQGVRTIKENRL